MIGGSIQLYFNEENFKIFFILIGKLESSALAVNTFLWKLFMIEMAV